MGAQNGAQHLNNINNACLSGLVNLLRLQSTTNYNAQLVTIEIDLNYLIKKSFVSNDGAKSSVNTAMITMKALTMCGYTYSPICDPENRRHIKIDYIRQHSSAVIKNLDDRSTMHELLQAIQKLNQEINNEKRG